jgi:ribosomal small subunit protein bTHX
MGRGDFRSKKGKIRRGSYGNSRPKASKLRAIAKKLAAALKPA